jgi:hypothetical protein
MVSVISWMVLEWRQTYRNIYGKYRNGSGKFWKFRMYQKLLEGGDQPPSGRVGSMRPMVRLAGWPSGRKGLLLPPLGLEVEEEIPLLFSFQFRWGLPYWVQFEFEKV